MMNLPNSPNFIEQYTWAEFVTSSELLCGQDWLSFGGEPRTRELLSQLNLQPGMRMLDIGCGCGGSAFFAAQNYGLLVDGLDAIARHIEQAIARATELELDQAVNFEQADIFQWRSHHQYDLVFSLDTFAHIHHKPHLLQVIKQCLKPGGILLFEDYCLGKPTLEMFDYAAKYDYDMIHIQQYCAYLRHAGFSIIAATDISDNLLQYSQAIYEKAQELDLQLWVEVLETRIKRILDKQHIFGRFHCQLND